MTEPSLRLRFWAALLLFASAYSPLMLILIVKDYDPNPLGLLPRHPLICLSLLIIAIASCVGVLHSMKEIRSGLPVEVTKAANKSGEMFGYTIPYLLSFLRVDLGDWQTMISLMIFLAMMFVVAYRTQIVFVNPVLALAGYMLIDCTFRHGLSETQTMVITRIPLRIGRSYVFERLSYYLYVASNEEPISGQREGT